MPRCHIALGGNVGNVEATFQTALARLSLEAAVTVVRVSSVWRTRAVGPRAGGEFLNAAAEIETPLEPLPLLDILKERETHAGRTHEEHWEPRPLDLDLIFYADQIIGHPRLRIPHPACWYRRFVLDPLAQIAADVQHPIKGLTVGELRARLGRRPLELALAGGTSTERQRLRRELSSISADAEVVDWQPNEGGDPTVLSWLGPSDEPGGPANFDELPLVPRLDASKSADVTAFLRSVLQAALG